MSELVPSEPAACMNCGHTLFGDYCANCGQDTHDMRQPFFRLLKAALHNVFELDGRAYKTLFYLFTRPGFLSEEYTSGRRASYTPPLRLYLLISIGFFLMIAGFNSLQTIQATLQGEEQTSLLQDPELIAALAEENLDLEGISTDASNEDLTEFLGFIDTINLPLLSDQANANFHLALRRQAETNFSEVTADPASFFLSTLEYFPIFMLLMMPILALIQKILFYRARRFYVEHLILTLHNHAFIILAFFLGLLVGLVEDLQINLLSATFGYLGSAISIWMLVYLYLSLKNFFHRGFVLTMLLYIASTILYSVSMALGLFVLMVSLFFLF